MVRREPSENLQWVLEQLSDGFDVDWERANDEASSAEERTWLENLRLVDRVSGLARAEDPSQLLEELMHGERAPNPRAPLADNVEETVALPTEGVSESVPPGKRGDTWGPLQLLEVVGRGAFGEVHRAWDPVLNRQVALKLMNTRSLEMEGAQDRVLEEARLLAKVEHPNVARIYGVEERAGQVGIWMEFVQGTDLAGLLHERGRLTTQEAAEIGLQLCDALQAVHAANVIHKDIKPQNVMRLPDGRVLLMDFGAGSRRQVHEGETERFVTGTPRYMAPEIFEQEKATPQSDLYSVGVLLYTLVSGAYPVEGTVSEIRQSHRERRRVPLSERDVRLPAGFAELVDRVTAHERVDRFASASELAEALREFVDPPRAEPTPAREPVSFWRPTRRWAWAAGLVAAVGLSALTLSNLLAPAPPLEAEVSLRAARAGISQVFEPGDRIARGDRVEAKISLNRDAYVYVLNRDSEGSTTVLYPMAGDPRGNRLPGGREHRIPGEIHGEMRYWGIGGGGEMETFLVLASVEPLQEFEQSLLEVAAVNIGGGLRVRPIDGMQLASLDEFGISGPEPTRGVTGLVGAAADDELDIFARAELLAENGFSDGSVYLYHLSLRK